MTMRIHKIITHFGPEEAYTLIDFLDQLRAVMIQSYGDEIAHMLQQTQQPFTADEFDPNDEPF